MFVHIQHFKALVINKNLRIVSLKKNQMPSKNNLSTK